MSMASTVATLYPSNVMEMEQRSLRAPSLVTHLSVVAVLLVFGIPAIYFIQQDQMLAATLLISIPLSVICLLEPFLGLCFLFAISPLDTIYAFGIPYLSGSKVLAIPVGLGFLLHLIIRPEARFHVPREVKMLWVLAVWAIVVIAWSIYPFHSMFASSALVTLSIFTVMVIGMVRTPEHFKQLMLYVLAGSVIVGFVGLITPTSESVARVSFPDLNANNFVRALVFGSFAAVFLAWESRGLIGKVAYALAGLFLLLPIAGSQGRGGMFAMAGAIVVAVLVTYRRKWLKAFLIMVGVGLFVYMLMFALVELGFFTEKAIERLQQPLREAGQSRYPIWRAGIQAGRQRPLRGWGFGTFGVATGTARDAHDNYLRLFVELGIPGLAIWVVVLAMLAIKSVRMWTGSVSFLMAALVSMVILGGITFQDLVGKTVWYEIGCVLAMWQVFSPSAQTETIEEIEDYANPVY